MLLLTSFLSRLVLPHWSKSVPSSAETKDISITTDETLPMIYTNRQQEHVLLDRVTLVV